MKKQRIKKVTPIINKDNTNALPSDHQIQIPIISNVQTVPIISTTQTTQYTDIQIQELLADGYMLVLPQLWDRIPKGAHIMYFTTGDAPKCERFNTGGFVNWHLIPNETGLKEFKLESRLNGAGFPGHRYYNVKYDDIDELWKKYDAASFVEVYLIRGSLIAKSKQIEELKIQCKELIVQNTELTAQCEKLSSRIEVIENILREVIK